MSEKLAVVAGIMALLILCLLFFLFVHMASDRFYEFSASKVISASLDRGCLLEALRAEEKVREAGVGPTGAIYAELLVPKNLKGPPQQTANVENRTNDRGQPEIALWVTSSPSALNPDYQGYVQKTIEELRDRAIEKCGAR